IYTGLCILYEIILFFLIFNAPDLVGSFYGIYYFRPKLIPLIFYGFAVITVFITGLLLTNESFKSNDQKHRWKGKFLLLAFISLTVSLTCEGLVEITTINYIFIKILHISSAFEYYLGFFLPDKISNLLIKEENNNN
ncbi:MAG: hypothetical protein ACFFAO_16525, partial [Candidatus Hermodarchaeota archaeon]